MNIAATSLVPPSIHLKAAAAAIDKAAGMLTIPPNVRLNIPAVVDAASEQAAKGIELLQPVVGPEPDPTNPNTAAALLATSYVIEGVLLLDSVKGRTSIGSAFGEAQQLFAEASKVLRDPSSAPTFPKPQD